MLLREEPELLPQSLVVRAGEMNRRLIESSVRTCFKRHKIYGISVCAGRDDTLDDLYEKSDKLRVWPQYRATTAGALLTLSKQFTIKLIPTSKVPHYTLDIGQPVDDALWTLLDGVFGPVTPRPEWTNHEGNR